MNSKKVLAAFALLISVLQGISSHAEEANISSTPTPGVTNSEIIIGMSNVLEGPAKALGTSLKIGADVYFNKINAAGGVHGRSIKVISYDDGYEPVRTILNTKKLIDEDQVFMLFGYVGTPTSKVAVPIATRAKVPYFAPFTGAEFLREPVNRYVFNVRASYFDETEALVNHMIDDLGIQKIGAFIQNDGYGAAGRAGIQRALEKRGLEIAVVGKYERNTVNIEQGLKEIMTVNPEAVIMVGAYQPCAAFIRQAKTQGFAATFANISFVGTNALVEEVGAAGENTFISQVVPHPTESNLETVIQYREDMAEAGLEASISFGSLEGYLDALVLVEALKKHGPELTREGLIDTLETLDLDLEGLRVTLSPENHQGLNQVYLTKIKNGEAISVEKLD